MGLTLYLVRHAPVHPLRAQTVYGNDANIIDVSDTQDVAVSQPQRDALTAQFQRLAAKLSGTAPFIMTQARRTRQTLDQVQNHMPTHSHLRILYPWFVEQQWGDWTDMPHTVLVARDLNYRLLRNKGPGWEALTPPNHMSGYYAESFDMLTRRVEMGFEQILVAQAFKGHSELVAFAHGGVVRAAKRLFGSATALDAITTNVPHLSVTTLTHTGQPHDKWKLVKLAEPT